MLHCVVMGQIHDYYCVLLFHLIQTFRVLDETFIKKIGGTFSRQEKRPSNAHVHVCTLQRCTCICKNISESVKL